MEVKKPGDPWLSRWLLPAAGLLCAVANAAPLTNRDSSAEIVMKITAPFTVTAVGDIIEPQPLYSDDPAFRKLVERIRQADVGFGNMESSLVDFRTFQGPVAGTEAPLETGDAIKAMGITLMSRANNHAFDGGVMGMISTDEALDKLGIAHAGTGRNLQEARAARYVETPKGRVGLVSVYSVDDSSSYGPHFAKTEATYRNGNLGGAPGLNPLHLTTYHVVSPEIATIHTHQTTEYDAQGVRGVVDHNAADFLVKLAHDSIDNGADMFVAHAARGGRFPDGRGVT